jgi:tryptophan 2,3-dioxygenase
MIRRKDPIYYGEYLHLKELTDLQKPESAKFGSEAHDETLFIIVHQVYELWFKQILHELHSIRAAFSKDIVDETNLSKVSSRLQRVIKIQQLLLQQLEVMETMTPMDFLEFRDLLIPASGFQSVQFREIETILGLTLDKRTNVDRDAFLGRLKEQDREKVKAIEEEPNLFDLISGWLERMPFTHMKHFNFWEAYGSTVDDMLKKDRQTILENPLLTEQQQQVQITNLDEASESFQSLLDDKKYQKLLDDGSRSLSNKAMRSALFIFLYREEPVLTQPYNILNSFLEIDGNFTTWRQRHALMAHRMLGRKIGTGGSSGHHYLKAAAENNRIYTDLYDLSTFLIPRSCLPVLPEALAKELSYYYGN